MIRKAVRVRESQKGFIDDSAYQLSKLIRNAIDEAMMGERGYPTGSGRRSHDNDYKQTNVLIDEHHEFFIQENDVNFSQLVDDVIDERIEIERKLNEMDE